jgi:two-component system response regulator AgrA
MRINILEDNWQQQGRIEQILMTVIKENKLPFSYIEFYSSPEKLLQTVSLGGVGQVYFLKIVLEDEDTKGIALAKQIREQDPFAHIIFLTSQMQHMARVFELHIRAMDYIDKTIDDKQLKERVSDLFISLKDFMNISHDEVFGYVNHRQHFQIPYHQILYFETSVKSHHVNLVTKNRSIEFEGNLIDIVGKHPKLYRCHRSFIINIANISRIDWGNRSVEFENGDSCMISRSKLEGLVELVGNQ